MNKNDTPVGLVRRGRMFFMVVLSVASFLCILFLVVISPLPFVGLQTLTEGEIRKLSDIGQAYGAASAVLSAFAFGGIAISLILQVRQGRASHMHAVRTMHMELLKIALDDVPVYWPVLNGNMDMTSEEVRRRTYANLWIQHAYMASSIGVMEESSMRKNLLAGMFMSEESRRFWLANRDFWKEASRTDRRRRIFVRIVEEEYQKAVALEAQESPMQAVSRTRESLPLSKKRAGRIAATSGLIGLSVGVLSALVVRHVRSIGDR